MAPTERTIERFKNYASPAIFVCGIVWGLIFMVLSTTGTTIDARVLLSALFISASVMAFCYTEPKAMQEHTIPFLVEILRYFFSFWFLFGIVWVVRIFGSDPPPQEQWALYTVSFLVGSISGSVWGLGLVLFIGRRIDIAAWNVVRFPVWTLYIASRIRSAWKHLVRRR